MFMMQPDNMITANFSRDEIKCRCGCGIDLVSMTLMCKLQVVRDQYFAIFKEGLTLNSVCRCPKHNQDVKGEANSTHITTDSKAGEAADILCTDSHKRFVLLGLLRDQFNRLEIGSTWLHVDVATDDEHPKEVIFLT